MIKSDLGKSISIMRKPESYLMVGICDGYDLYFAGKKLTNGAFVAVSAFGTINPSDAQRMTASVCEILSKRLSVDGSDVYVTYTDIDKWGWDGSNI